MEKENRRKTWLYKDLKDGIMMGKKGVKRHMKREISPVFWPIHRKEKVWTVHPSPGAHSITKSLPLILILRDLLGYAETYRETKFLIKEGKVKVDGRIRYDERSTVGLMDVVEIPEAKKYFRVLSSRKGLILHPINMEESGFKLCRIESKTYTRGGNIQINLHDGRNMLLKSEDPLQSVEDVFKVYDIFKIKVPKQDLEEHLRFDEGILALAIAGASRGRYGEVVKIEKRPGLSTTVTLKSSTGDEVRTIVDYIFPVGIDSPLISLPRGM